MQRLRKCERGPLAGVCGGLAEFLGWPARKVRTLWVLGTVLTGGAPGILAYTVLAILMPSAGAPSGSFRLENHRQQ